MKIDHMIAEKLCETCARASGMLEVGSGESNPNSAYRYLIEHCNKISKLLIDACEQYRNAYHEEIRQQTLNGKAQPLVDVAKKEATVSLPIKLGFKKLDPEAKLPEYAHSGDAGMDVFALDDVDIPLHIPTMVHTGISAEIPDGYEIQVRPRSGLACKGVTVWNSPGTVDSKYRGEICVILMYLHNECEQWEEPRRDTRTGKMIMVGVGTRQKQKYEVKAGDKIAQLVLAPVTFADPVEVTELSETERGTGGFGSTGR